MSNESHIREFLKNCARFSDDWADLHHAEIIALQADASKRRYFRLAGRGLLVMYTPTDYADNREFAKISRHLLSVGLLAPHCLYADHDKGFMLLNDFGDTTFTRAIANGHDENALYKLATKALIKLHRNPRSCFVNVPKYDFEKLRQEARLFPEWYVPYKTGQQCTEDQLLQWDNLWQDLYLKMPAYQETLVLRDYHVDNLMVVDGFDDCALLDFQDALKGHPSYDLVSLCEDARRVVDKGLVDYCVTIYLQHFYDLDRENFGLWYDFLGANRHAKVLGIFVRLKQRDGKGQYEQYLPNVEQLFKRKLQLPYYGELHKFITELGCFTNL